MDTKLSSTVVSRKLISSEFQLREQTGRSTSSVWKQFGIVTDTDGNDLGYAACKECYQAFNYKGRSSGTSTLSKHQCKVTSGQTFLKPSHGAKVLPLFPSSKEQIKPSTELKKTITDACTNFVCEDLRPLDLVKGSGFLNLINSVSCYHHYTTIWPIFGICICI